MDLFFIQNLLGNVFNRWLSLYQNWFTCKKRFTSVCVFYRNWYFCPRHERVRLSSHFEHYKIKILQMHLTAKQKNDSEIGCPHYIVNWILLEMHLHDICLIFSPLTTSDNTINTVVLNGYEKSAMCLSWFMGLKFGMCSIVFSILHFWVIGTTTIYGTAQKYSNLRLT